MKVYMKTEQAHAWLWITHGYLQAWSSLGYDVEPFVNISDLSNINPTEEYILSIREWDIKNEIDMQIIKNAKSVYLFAQPQKFTHPWGTHQNWLSSLSDGNIDMINNMNHVKLWTYASVNPDYYYKWKEISTLPLGFDSFSYKTDIPFDESLGSYDVCFIGSWANNGFDEKRQLIIDYLSEFKKTDLKCGFFVNKGLPHETENYILCNSKVCINIHDKHHLVNGFDTNERTFKSLGAGGCLVSDSIGRGKETNQLTDLFPDLPLVDNPSDMVEMVTEYVKKPSEELKMIKELNKKNILDNHTYVSRVKEMLSL